MTTLRWKKQAKLCRRPNVLERLLELEQVRTDAFECDMLGRLGMVNRRCRHLTEWGPSWVARWRAAAETLDDFFPVVRPSELFSPINASLKSFDIEQGPSQFARATGLDPRLEVMFPLLRPSGRGIEEASFERGLEAWRSVHPKKRVAIVLRWQTDVCDECRACPKSYADGYDFGDYEYLVDAFYHPDGTQTDVLKLFIRLCYVKCCELDRFNGAFFCHAADVFANGWRSADFETTPRKMFHWDILMGEIYEESEKFDADDDDRESIVTKRKIKTLSSDESGIFSTLGAYIGPHLATKLTICRGEADLPHHWQQDFDKHAALVQSNHFFLVSDDDLFDDCSDDDYCDTRDDDYELTTCQQQLTPTR